jgi:hypothetical protein
LQVVQTCCEAKHKADIADIINELERRQNDVATLAQELQALTAALGERELKDMPQEWHDDRSARIEIKKGHELKIAELKAINQLPPCESTKTTTRGTLNLAPHVWVNVLTGSYLIRFEFRGDVR